MPAIKGRIEKAEIAIFPNQNGGIDARILDQIFAITDRLNALKSGFSREKQFKWFKIFNEIPKEVTYEECLEQARKLTEEYGNFSAYIEDSKARHQFNDFSPEKQKMFKEIFTD